jgi:ABC-2 type transport system permease protein
LEIFSVLKFEVKKNFKAILIFAGVIGGFVLMMLSIFDPGLFSNYNEIISQMPPEILELLGGQVDMGTFEGFFNLYIFEFSWMWYGLYLILKVAQDIPGEMENKTIDLVLSKPIRRWEFVLGKQFQHFITIIIVVIFSVISTIIAAASNPNVILLELDWGGIIISFFWLAILLIAIESTVLLISTVLERKKATAVGFAVVMGMWFLSAYSGSIPIDNIEYVSFFTFFNPRTLIIEGIASNILRDIFILIGYSIVISVIAVVYFIKRDIPV